MEAFSNLLSSSLGKLKPKSKPGPRIQLLSDLHLEIGQQYATFAFPATAPYLVLAGDIGRLIDYESFLGFLERLTPLYKRIFLVLGNHEFYGLTYDAGVDAARKLEREPRLQGKFTLLDKTRWDDPHSNLTVLGCTLWSTVPPASHDIVQAQISDFRKIDGWSVNKHNQVHEEEVAWLRYQVAQLATEAKEASGTGGSTAKIAAKRNRRNVCVATHHAPSLEGTSSPQHAGSPWTSAFATELLTPGDVWKGTVGVWVFGHTHYSNDLIRHGVRLVSNQRGYVFPGSSTESTNKTGTKLGKHEFDSGRVISV